jgi:uncharacterized protein YfaS (alpha-2-macroglobulin family)
VTFPNVLVLNYLKQTRQASPEIQMTAENYIALGYQRLLTFEVSGGGFSLFGSPPASLMLSAKGLLEFSDMAKVYPVDPALIERTRRWILAQQKSDGSWSGTASSWDSPPGRADNVALSAYIAWSLLESGAKGNPGADRAIAYIKENSARATDAYALALVANALATNDPNDSATRDALARLDQAKMVEGDTVYWTSRAGSFTGAYGVAGNIETTSLAAYAFLRARAFPDTAQRALTYLIQKKDPHGTWGSTQATILALRALIESALASGETAQEATVRISMNGAEAKPIVLNRENAGVAQLVTFDTVAPGSNRIAFKVEGKGSLAYQVTSSFYVPWANVPKTPEQEKLVDIQVAYDRTSLAVDEQAGVSVRVQLLKEGKARMTLVDLGVPPGFSVVAEDLDAAVKAKEISRYELAGRQIIVYLEEFTSKQPVTFKYHLKAKFPLRAQTPGSSTYDYYNPGVTASQAPLLLTVK